MKQFVSGTASRASNLTQDQVVTQDVEGNPQHRRTQGETNQVPLEGGGKDAPRMEGLRTNGLVNRAPGMKTGDAPYPNTPDKNASVADGIWSEDARTYDDPYGARAAYGESMGGVDFTIDPPEPYQDSNTGIGSIKKNPYGYAGAFDTDYQQRKR